MLNLQTDWRILALRNQYRQYAQDYDLAEPVWIGDTCYQFQQEPLFEGKIKVYLPSQFKDLSEESVRERYPSIHRPQVIRSNEDNTVHFSFSLVGGCELPLTAEAVWQEIDRLFPSNVLYDTGSCKAGGLDIVWLEYKSFSTEAEVYNILFPIMSKGAEAVIGAFHCPFTSYDIWKPCVLQVIRTIQD